MIAFKFNSKGALSRAFEKPPAVERGVLRTLGLIAMDGIARLRLLRMVCFALALSACRREEGEPVARDALRAELIGCYALFGNHGRPVDSGYYNASPLVQLDTFTVGVTPRDERPGVLRVLHRLDARGRRQDTFDSRTTFGPAWSADSLTDSIRLSFSDGFSGAYFVLAAPPARLDTLRGRAEEHWDFGSPIERGRARAVRITCVSSVEPDVASGGIRVPQNYPLQLSGATSKVVIAVRLLEAQQQGALSRAFKSAACS